MALPADLFDPDGAEYEASEVYVTGSVEHTGGTQGLAVVAGHQGQARVEGTPLGEGVAVVHVVGTDPYGQAGTANLTVVVFGAWACKRCGVRRGLTLAARHWQYPPATTAHQCGFLLLAALLSLQRQCYRRGCW